MQNVLAPLLEVVNLMVTSVSYRISVPVAKKNAIEKEIRLLDAVTQFFVSCTPKSLSFRSCTSFVVNQLEIALRGQQRQRLKLPWPMLMQWVVCLATFLGQLDPQHMELGRRTFVALISVLKQLPVEFTKGDQMDYVLINLSNIFDVAGVPSSSMTEDERKRMRAKTRFDALAAADQLAFRREAIDLAHINSFFVSTALASVEDKAHEQQLKLVHHVCRTLLAMKLGNSLSKILTSTLAKVHAGGTMNLMKMHVIMLLYRVCIASATRSAEERADIPVEMERELVDLNVKILVNCMRSSATEHFDATNARDQELLLVETCISTLVLGEINLFTMFLDKLVVGQEPEQVVTHRLRVLQALGRTSSLAGPFRRH
ncbi:hypothetical protein PsorP6_010114 [Peronosclerospora sorghi]|uniref:Uncharacterized protein n=1 Tax=Peronosclerospora sorghi TaxID=230839 RepID=A0ACC0VWL3_9STRA|nr:hypothetical protein PsorP6_010114 [Peronosclerospora sorghi]